MYNLLSDKLDRFEKEIRRVRNKFYGKVSKFFLRCAKYLFKSSRAYLHTDVLIEARQMIAEMKEHVEMELESRKRGANFDYPGLERDTTVLTSEQVRQRLWGGQAPPRQADT